MESGEATKVAFITGINGQGSNEIEVKSRDKTILGASQNHQTEVWNETQHLSPPWSTVLSPELGIDWDEVPEFIPGTSSSSSDDNYQEQDGSYLAELLMGKGYEVHGIIRRASSFNTKRIDHLHSDRYSHKGGKLHLHYGDMTDSSCLIKIISSIRPTEIYNLAAQSHVKVSFDLSEYTAEVDALGTLRLLDAIRTCSLDDKVKFYQASTSEMYGKVAEIPQTEKTPFYPRSPYACAKVYAYWIVVNYREAYNMFACNGILFNHESPRRGETFVTRKITREVAKIHLGLSQYVELGNLDSKRDWGHAKDYVEAMWLMLQQETPEDYVIASGETHSVREFLEASFQHVGKQIVWEGSGVDEVGKEKDTGIVRVRINPKYFRPTEVDFLLGDASKANKKFGWTPKVSFPELVKDMMDSDIELMKTNPTA